MWSKKFTSHMDGLFITDRTSLSCIRYVLYLFIIICIIIILYIILYCCVCQESHQLYRQVSNQCLDCNRDTREIYMSQCSDVETQKWAFTSMNSTALAELWKERLH